MTTPTLFSIAAPRGGFSLLEVARRRHEKSLLFSLVLLAGAWPAWAQPDSAVESERARISAERNQAEARFAAQEVACYKIFAVNDCLKAARSQRRERLADLRRQELSLTQAERKRRAAERVRSIEERDSAQRQEETAAQRAESMARQREKQEAVGKRAAERAQSATSAADRPARARAEPAEPAAPAASRAAKAPRSVDTAKELRRSQIRQQEAQERRERVARRLAEAGKSGVKPLPVPP